MSIAAATRNRHLVQAVRVVGVRKKRRRSGQNRSRVGSRTAKPNIVKRGRAITGAEFRAMSDEQRQTHCERCSLSVAAAERLNGTEP